MKKQFLFIGFALMLVSGMKLNTSACTNFLVTKGASIDGSTMITYAADSHILYGELYYRPAQDYPEGAMMDIYEWDTYRYLGKIKQVKHTYSVVGNMNEHQVAIGETTYGGREELFVQPGAVIDYGSLIYVTLQRAKTAREAIKTFAELMNEYGYASEGESFSISDPNEVWIMEVIGKGRTYKFTKNTISALQSVDSTKAIASKISKLVGKNIFKDSEYITELEKLLGKEDAKKYKDLIAGKCESTQKGAVWVAMMVPDGYVCAHANHPRITTFAFQKENKWDDKNQVVFHAPDVISFAKDKGFYTGSDANFSFSDIYAPLDFEGARFCEMRVWAMFNRINSSMGMYKDYAGGKVIMKDGFPSNRMPLWIKPDKKLSVHDLMEFMRDHLEGTEFDMTKDMGAGPYGLPYRWRPLTWKVGDATYCNERATATQQTGFSFVAQARSWLPDPIGGIFWFGVDDANSCVYAPMYCGMTKVPESYAVGNGDMLTYSETSAFWAFNTVANFAYLKYNVMIKDIQKVQRELENKFISYTPEIDKAAEDLYKKDPALGRQFLTDYSVNQGNYTVKRWKELFQYLMVKYIDGNEKKEKDGKFERTKDGCPVGPNQPGYPEWWLQEVVKQTGDHFKVIESESAH